MPVKALTMSEDKRSGKKGLPTADSHVDGGNGKKKAIVYNTKKGKKGRTRKKD